MSATAVASVRRLPTWPLWLMSAPAAVAIWSGWVGLGGMTGFGRVHPLPGILNSVEIDTAITLPVGVESYAAYALRCWLAGVPGRRSTRFARASSLASLLVGGAGQVAYHLMVVLGIHEAPWWIVAVVSILPVAVLGMGASLAYLVRHDATAAGDATPAAPIQDPLPGLDRAPWTPALSPVAPLATDPADAGATPSPDTAPVMPSPAIVSPDATPEVVAPVLIQDPLTGLDAADDNATDDDQPAAPELVRVVTPRTAKPTTAEVLELMAAEPDLTQSEVAERLGTSVRTVQRRLQGVPVVPLAEAS